MNNGSVRRFSVPGWPFLPVPSTHTMLVSRAAAVIHVGLGVTAPVADGGPNS